MKELGQYFTVHEQLQQYVFDLVKNKNQPLLEPSVGAGHLLLKFGEDYPITCYEIDTTIDMVVPIQPIYGDFLEMDVHTKFKTIIGNPPFVKHTKGNLYIQFIEKCVELLDDGGELIFIVPSDFIKATRASKIITKMATHGTFTDFWFPNNERLFDKASVDVVVFRYQKDIFGSETILNGNATHYQVVNGIITFVDNPNQPGVLVSNIFDVYVGMVSGKDDVFKTPIGNIDILTNKNKTEKFIFSDTFPTMDTNINLHLTKNKSILLDRKIRKFNQTNWFQWGAPRNFKNIQNNLGKKCIYIQTITRNKEVSFIGDVSYFGGQLICLIPRVDVDLQSIVDLFNSESFRQKYTYSGRFKIGHKHVSNVRLSHL